MDDERELSVPTTRSSVARLLLESLHGDEDALAALVDRALGDPLAVGALDVVLELRAEAAERAGGLPPVSRDLELRLEETVRAATGQD